jgi:hypothetical protein
MGLQSVLLAVDSDREVLAALDHDLTRRFAGDYRILTADTPRLRWRSLMLMMRSLWSSRASG